MPVKTIKVAIADESFLFAKILKNYLMEHSRIQVNIHAVHFPQLISKLEHLSADILLTDILHHKDAIENMKLLKENYPDLKIIILSMCKDMELINNLLDIGIYGFISKMDEPEGLIEAILAVSEGKMHRSDIFTDTLYWNVKQASNIYHEGREIILNTRERRILQLLWEEKSNKEIANEFFLSIKSIEKIRQDLKEKLGVKSTVGLFKYAIGQNIISAGSYETGRQEVKVRW
ncbi:response regulator transcription factor [Chitinophaga sancti]|uniref:response regulator transcription factor n=1 Tax=Chitinophaga sancti TaxID=1004 RepID=UPI002A7580AC|nr:response regulator transcription factor [Chitinophaga sancti]WPQ62332.1 response regulator transcription factor [Chitinophaga sancti]